ncbi:MAG: glycosyltransferase family 4 protein [Planctomycetota bacterium]
MRIVFFDFILYFGGGSQLAADTAKRLAVEHDVRVVDAYGVCAPYLKMLKEAGIRTHVLVPEVKHFFIGYQGRKLRRIWRMACQTPVFLRVRQRLIREIREIDPDVIWTNSELSLLFLGSSLRLWRYPVAMYVCGCREAAAISRRDRWLMRHAADLLMAISTETARQLRLVGLPEERIRIVFDTIDVQDTLRRSTAPLEAPLPGLDKRPRILLPATLLRTKGQHTAIRAVGRMKAQGLDPVLWLAGHLTGHDRSYAEFLERLVRELDLSDNVYFLGWRDDVPAIIAQADIVVLPTHTEGFGHVILEAMLLRRPAVTTHVGGIKDSIEDGVNGLIFPVEDDAALAIQLKRLATDSRCVSMLVNNGYKTVMEKFNPPLHTRRVTEALRSTARSAGR